MEAELRSSLEQINRNPFCERVCDSEHGDAAPCRLVARGVGRFAACKGSAAEFVSPISMRHRLPFAHYAAPYAAVLACKASDECSEFCEEAGLCAA